MTDQAIPSDWVRASLSGASLALLKNKALHGYALLNGLQAQGYSALNGGTLYPLLSRLEDAGYVTFTWDTSGKGPAKKVYSITESGQAALSAFRQEWREVRERLNTIFDD